jgi:hypothetical protein
MEKTLVMLAVLHGSAILLCAGLVFVLARSTPDSPSDEGSGPGAGGEWPPVRPRRGPIGGGFRPADSRTARVRLRGPVRRGAPWSRPARRAHPEIDPGRAPCEKPLLRLSGGVRR